MRGEWCTVLGGQSPRAGPRPHGGSLRAHCAPARIHSLTLMHEAAAGPGTKDHAPHQARARAIDGL